MMCIFRFITAVKNIPDEKELQYTTDMIYDNFSNYSAWHNRRYVVKIILLLLTRTVQLFRPGKSFSFLD